MTRVFLDVNVLFSASRPQSPLGRLFAEAERRAHLVTSTAAAEEARRNLAAKRPEALSTFESLLGRCECVESALFALAIELNENDRAVLCAAIRAECDYFVTGDKQHFGAHFGERVESVTVLSTAQFAYLLRRIPPDPPNQP